MTSIGAVESFAYNGREMETFMLGDTSGEVSGNLQNSKEEVCATDVNDS